MQQLYVMSLTMDLEYNPYYIEGKPKGYAFVTFDSETSASSAMHAMNGNSYQGRDLTVSMATARGTGVVTTSAATDDSWKTVPTAPRSNRSVIKPSGSKSLGDAKGGKTLQKMTWDHWASPVVKS